MIKKSMPDNFKKYFWDCNFNELSLKKYFNFILSRLLNYGDDDTIAWVISHVKKNKLIKSILKSRELDEKTKNYWCIMLGLPND